MAHKKTYTVTAICENIVVKKATLQASPEGLVTFCKKYFPEAWILRISSASDT
jgi:hypothetical protein